MASAKREERQISFNNNNNNSLPFSTTSDNNQGSIQQTIPRPSNTFIPTIPDTKASKLKLKQQQQQQQQQQQDLATAVTTPAPSTTSAPSTTTTVSPTATTKTTTKTKTTAATATPSSAAAPQPTTAAHLEPHHHSSRLAVRAGVTRTWLLNHVFGTRQAMEGLAGSVFQLTPRIRTTGKDALSVYLFGTEYNVAETSEQSPNGGSKTSEDEEELHQQQHERGVGAGGNSNILTHTDLQAHFEALLWFTYRRNFIPMQPPSSYTSDTGWGCMLRSAQMILAQALQRHFFSDGDWMACETHRGLKERRRLLLRWFVDAPKLGAVYSIHRMTQCGVRYGKQPGEWYGPTTAALVLRDLVESHRLRPTTTDNNNNNGQQASKSTRGPLLSADSGSLNSATGESMAMLVADDGTIYTEEVMALCQTESTTSAGTDSNRAAGDPLVSPPPVPHWHTSLFILMPLRLGLDKLNPQYLEPLVRALRIKQCVGMIGGKPAHSLFFVGSQGHNLLYLDPHTVQPAAIERTVAEIKAAVDARKHRGNGTTTTNNNSNDATAHGSASSIKMGTTPPLHSAQHNNSNNNNNNNTKAGPSSPLSSEMYLLPTDDDVATYRCSDVKLMAAKDIDPSLALGFFCQSRMDFDMLCNRISELKEYGLPMLNVMAKKPNYDDLMGGFDDDDDDDGEVVGEGFDDEGSMSGVGDVMEEDDENNDDDDDDDLDKFEDAKDNDAGGDEFVML